MRSLEVQGFPGERLGLWRVTMRRMPERVLIVDDHPTFRRFARRLLQDEGFVVVGEADDGASALDAVRELLPEVVLLDVMLPDVSGIDLAERLAAMAGAPTVVLISSRSASDYGTSLEGSSARAFIAKGDLTGASLRAAVAAE
jgi:DNA-binding NarL/FixJ family response regulator